MNEIRITGDGSHTLFSHSFCETYHSSFGAVTESAAVFIENGLHGIRKNPVSVFEVGFGTGLNAYMACLDAQQNHRTVMYHAIEKYPPEPDLISALNYPEMLACRESGKIIFTALHEAEWNKAVNIAPGFTLFKIRADLCTFRPAFTCDVVFFDAFAPERQPGMWTAEIFRMLYAMLNPGGILTTYCVKGEVKRRMKEAGFYVEKQPGPPGKREILRACKN